MVYKTNFQTVRRLLFILLFIAFGITVDMYSVHADSWIRSNLYLI